MPLLPDEEPLGFGRAVNQTAVRSLFILMTSMAIAEEGSRRSEAESVLRLAAPRLLAIAAVIVGSVAEAEDVLQDVMIAAWRAWDRIHAPARRDAWLTRICVRESVHHGQKLRSRWLHEDNIDLRRSGSPPTQPDADWDGAFAVLSRQQRAVVVLHFYYGYTLDECSRLMGCRPGSARQHLARALRHLREVMNDAV
jgi:RNA polymerase sigma-70 factor, ECF subfamily